MTTFLSALSSQTKTDAIGADTSQHCLTCGYRNPTNAEICLNCSSALGTSCPVCRQAVPAGNKFCSQCGTHVVAGQRDTTPADRQREVLQNLQALMPTALAQKITAASGEIIGEHREVTVLCASLTYAAAGDDPPDEEDIYFYKDEALRLLVEVVYRYEGTVDKFTEEGLMALFGAPVAHENDPERAIRAALEMRSAIEPWQARVKQADGLDFELRLGLNTGSVIAGKVGNDLHMDYTVVGETVNLASHLETLADPGTILTSRETYQRSRPLFEFKVMPSLTVEWLPEPVQAFQPVGLLESRRARLSPGLQVPMVGRATDLDRLQNALRGTRHSGCRHIALVTGEAGLGKSRLIAEFRRNLVASDTRVYQGSCLAYARSSPLWVVAEVLRSILNLSETDPIDVQQKTLQAYLTQLDVPSLGILPYLSSALGLEPAETQAGPDSGGLDADTRQRQIHAAVRQVFLAEARRSPTVLVFEDLHWIDPASRDFLEYLIHTTDETPLLLVFVSRAAERRTVIRPLLAAAEKEPQRFVDLQLRALSEGEGQLLVDRLIPQTTAEASLLKQQIIKRAEGNPFFVEEIIRMLIDQGGLVRPQIDRAWHVSPRANELLNAIPGTVKGLILARFDRLPEGLRRVLQKAAVLGHSFPISLLRDLDNSAPETLTTWLDELDARQFIVAEPFRSEPGYSFRHALLQETVYSTLLKRDRRYIHTRVAQAIERSPLWLPEEQQEVLAYHYAEGTTPLKAVPFLISAAENAERRCAYETAIKHHRQAMNLLPDQPDDPSDAPFRIRIGLSRSLKFVGQFGDASRLLQETLTQLWLRQSLAADATNLRSILIESLRQLADIRQREGAYDEALAYLEAGLQVLGEAGDQDQPDARYSLLDRMAWIRFRQGKLDEAFSLARKATAGSNPDNTDDPSRLASLYNTMGGVLWHQGQLDAAINYVERSLQLYESVGHLWGMAISYGNLGVLYYARGDWPRAADYYEQAHAVQQVIGNPEGQAASYDNLGILRMAMGQHDTARQELERALAIRQRVGDAWGTAQSHVNLAQLAVVQARLAEASNHAEAALTMADTIGSSEVRIEARWILALVQAGANDLPAGLRSAEQALAMARTAGLSEKEADCLRVLGTLRGHSGQFDQAETLLRSSTQLALKQDDPYRQGLALLELGRIHRYQSRVDSSDRKKWQAEAHALLKEAAQRFAALGAAHDLQQAQTALQQLEEEIIY